MGTRLSVSEVQSEASGEATLWVRSVAPAALQQVDLIRRGASVESLSCEGQRSCEVVWSISGLESGDFLYLRVLQVDGGAAWSSPFFIEP